MNRIIYDFKMKYNGEVFEANNYDADRPFYTIDYSVEKNTQDKVSQSRFTLYNLPDNVRAWFAKSDIQDKIVSINFSIGNSEDQNVTQVFTGQALTIVSNGTITTATEINAYPLTSMQIYSQISIGKGASTKDLKTLFASKLGLKLNNQANDDSVVLTKNYNICTHDILSSARTIFSKQTVIVNGSNLVFMLKSSKPAEPKTNPYIFTESNGLLEYPTASGVIVEVRTLLRPNITISDNVVVSTKTNLGRNFNGSYIATGLKHSGKISFVHASLNESVFQLRK